MQVVILSVPYCEPYPLVAPVLLSACLNQAGISALGIDFNAKFIKEFSNEPYYAEFRNFLSTGGLLKLTIDLKTYKKILRFSLNFLREVHQKYNPKIIGLSMFSSESLDFGLVLCYLIRKYFPQTEIMVGGKGIEVQDQDGRKIYQAWVEQEIADIVIVGDAEAEIISCIKENKKGLVFCKQQTKEDLDAIPVPKWDDYDLNVYSSLRNFKYENQKYEETEPYMAVTASKGCVRKCTFCDVQEFWPDYIFRDPEKVANEIITNYKNTGIKKFKFTDNLINGSITNYRKMNQVLADQIPNTIKYSGFAIFRGKEQMPAGDFVLAAKAGCETWAIGVESGSEKVRFDLKKKFTNDDIDWSATQLYKNNIQQSWLLFVGYPSESESDFEDTKNLLKRYSYMNTNEMLILSPFSPFMLLNNSPLLTNKTLSDEYGLGHHLTSPFNDKLWTSTKYTDNNFSTRAKRWKELYSLVLDLGYKFTREEQMVKMKLMIDQLDVVYNDSRQKVFPIYSNR